jgi:hypothetical protein
MADIRSSRAHKFLNRLFGSAEEINGANRCPTYLYRWMLVSLKGRKAYLHHFVGDDWSLDLHCHPKRFISIGLWGSYVEITPNGQKSYRAPWIRSFPAEHKHRLMVGPNGNCWTLVVVLRPTREWGFWPDGVFIPWRAYVKSETADRRKSCP